MTDTPPALACPPAWASLPGRSALLVRGPDAVRFIDHFTTASVARLAAGAGTEGFFTDARGHVLALVNLLRTEDGLWLDAAAGIADPLRAHLGHYLIRERVEFVDAGAACATGVLLGPTASAWLAAHAIGRVPAGALDHARLRLGGLNATVVALDWFGPGGLLVQVSAADATALAAWFVAEGLTELAATAVEAARIEAASPEPIDIDPKTLPQELGRDSRAISFTKGCYLGQETVARLDALGHVNRRLALLAGREPPVVGSTVTCGGEQVGRITSACASRRLACGLGLALVHVRALAGADLAIDGRPFRPVPPSVAIQPEHA